MMAKETFIIIINMIYAKLAPGTFVNFGTDIHNFPGSSDLTFPLAKWVPSTLNLLIQEWICVTRYPLRLGGPIQCGMQFARHFYT